jgi:sodium/proline symporter
MQYGGFMNILTLIAFGLYLTVVVIVALVAYRVTHNLSDFVLGGRSLGGAVAALSAGASDMSAWLLLGLPGAVFAMGLNQIWLPLGLTIGAYISWRLLAKPLRVFSEHANDSLTVPSFLDNRFPDESRWIRTLLAIVTLVFFAFYTASGLVGGAMLLQRFGLSYHEALWIGTSIIVAYTFIGGFLAVSWTDFFQGIFMFICLLLVPYLACQALGGVDITISMIAAKDPNLLNPFKEMKPLLIINLLAWGLGYLGQPHILVRYMAVRDVSAIKLARRICVSWMSLSMIGALLTGFVGIAYFEAFDINPESVFILFSQHLFTPWLAGILFAAILSSIMCAIDSQMLASSSALTEDIYRTLIRKKASQKELVWIGRVAIILISLVAVSLANNPESKVIDLVAFAWAGLGASFGPTLVFSLFWRRMTKQGALMGIIIGASTVIIWQVNSGGIFQLYGIIPGYLLSSFGIIVGSLLDKPPTHATTQQFDDAWMKIRTTP